MYELDEITEELPFCMVAPGYKNNVDFRIESNLNLILAQNYSNFHIIYVDDGRKMGQVN